jgi:hypothetical protein
MTETTAAPAIAEAKPTHGLSIAEAVSQLKLNRESAVAPPPVEAPAEPAADASNPESGETSEAISVEGAEPDAEETTDETTEEATEEPSGEGYELAEDSKLILPDGTEWTAKELAEGTLRHKDYTKKTQALAEERRAVDAERKVIADKAAQFEHETQTQRTQLVEALKAAQAERDRYAQSVDEVDKALNAQGAEWEATDWEAEALRDPNGFPVKWARYQKYLHAVSITKAEKADLDAKRKAETETASQQSQEAAARSWQQSRSALSQHIERNHPDLLAPEKGKQEFVAMANTAEAAGMPKEVFMAAIGYAQSADVPIMHPAIFELRKATRYDRLVSEQSKVLASDKAPKPDATGKIKVVKATAARFRPPTQAQAAVGGAKTAFENSLSIQSAAKLMAARRNARQPS